MGRRRGRRVRRVDAGCRPGPERRLGRPGGALLHGGLDERHDGGAWPGGRRRRVRVRHLLEPPVRRDGARGRQEGQLGLRGGRDLDGARHHGARDERRLQPGSVRLLRPAPAGLGRRPHARHAREHAAGQPGVQDARRRGRPGQDLGRSARGPHPAHARGAPRAGCGSTRRSAVSGWVPTSRGRSSRPSGTSSATASRWRSGTAGSTWTTRRATETSGSPTTC